MAPMFCLSICSRSVSNPSCLSRPASRKSIYLRGPIPGSVAVANVESRVASIDHPAFRRPPPGQRMGPGRHGHSKKTILIGFYASCALVYFALNVDRMTADASNRRAFDRQALYLATESLFFQVSLAYYRLYAEDPEPPPIR